MGKPVFYGKIKGARADMSILIKGAKMPKKCCDCDLMPAEINWDEQWECPITGEIVHKYVEEREGKPPDCPLVEIPPHGDLIDRDAVRKQFAEMCEQCGEKYDAVCRACYVDTCDDIVDDVPAVIESEEE